MWKPPVTFLTLHYAYILSFGILALVIIYPWGNLTAIDAYFFGVSASTESGLNPIDVKALKTYQQVFVYITPIVTNLGFINIVVVVVRLRWFRRRFKTIVANSFRSNQGSISLARISDTNGQENNSRRDHGIATESTGVDNRPQHDAAHITFAPAPELDSSGEHALRIPGPRERNRGQPFEPVSRYAHADDIESATVAKSGETIHRGRSMTRSLSKAKSMERTVSSIFVLGGSNNRHTQGRPRDQRLVDLASMSIEELGGIEYCALRVLLKVTAGYFIGLHLFGVICLVPWIHLTKTTYRDYLSSQGQDKTWWAIYSSQTMVDNLGLTLTPDSMVSFRDATWPMLVMSFLAFAGNTFYPCFLRLFIWMLYKVSPQNSSLKESLRFLLDHPRRCYTLLFPSTATWILAAILVALNFLDTLLIVVLDLDNAEVNVLPVGSRILAAIFQAASSRHTGTATFNLANVNPAVQFSLLVMMYISIYPIAISVRMSTDYQEQPVGIYSMEEEPDEKSSSIYLLSHMRNQLSFDLWYIFLGVFCVCCAESKRIMDMDDYAFSVFSIFFEVVSAYGNVGLSLGHPSNSTSLSGHFTVFSKLVICAMMLRGRHRGLPYAVDRAITLPIDQHDTRYRDTNAERLELKEGRKMIKAYTQ